VFKPEEARVKGNRERKALYETLQPHAVRARQEGAARTARKHLERGPHRCARRGRLGKKLRSGLFHGRERRVAPATIRESTPVPTPATWRNIFPGLLSSALASKLRAAPTWLPQAPAGRGRDALPGAPRTSILKHLRTSPQWWRPSVYPSSHSK